MKVRDTLSDDQRALVLGKFVPEIKMIWSHIKAFAGLSGEDGWEARVKEAALARFDDSIGGFKFIRREHLEKKELCFLAKTQEYRDFQGRLLNMMVKKHFDLDISIRRLNAVVREYKKGKNGLLVYKTTHKS